MAVKIEDIIKNGKKLEFLELGENEEKTENVTNSFLDLGNHSEENKIPKEIEKQVKVDKETFFSLGTDIVEDLMKLGIEDINEKDLIEEKIAEIKITRNIDNDKESGETKKIEQFTEVSEELNEKLFKIKASGKQYSTEELQLMRKESKDFKGFIQKIQEIITEDINGKNEFRHIPLTQKEYIEYTLEDIKHAKKYNQLFDFVYKQVVKTEKSFIEIDERYKDVFDRSVTQYILKDRFDFGEWYELLTKEIGQNERVTNLDVINGTVSYTTDKTRDRRVYNNTDMNPLSNEEVDVMLSKLLRGKRQISLLERSANAEIQKLGYRINVKHEIDTSSTTHVLSIRRSSVKIDVEYLLKTKYFTQNQIDYLKKAIETQQNIMISGATGTGKTTVLNALKRKFIDGKNRKVLIIEDTREIHISEQEQKFQVVFLSQPDMKGSTDADHLTDALRQQADTLIVGEIRKKETAGVYIQATNTGTKGTVSTIHANTCVDALRRLGDLIKQYDTNTEMRVIKQQIRNSIDLVIQLGIEDYLDENGEKKTRFLCKEIAKIDNTNPLDMAINGFKSIEKKLKENQDNLEKLKNNIRDNINKIKEIEEIAVKKIPNNVDLKMEDIQNDINNKINIGMALNQCYQVYGEIYKTSISGLNLENEMLRNGLDYDDIKLEYIVKYNPDKKDYDINELN